MHSTHSTPLAAAVVVDGSPAGLLLPTLLSSSDGVRLAPHPLVDESVEAVETENTKIVMHRQPRFFCTVFR